MSLLHKCSTNRIAWNTFNKVLPSDGLIPHERVLLGQTAVSWHFEKTPFTEQDHHMPHRLKCLIVSGKYPPCHSKWCCAQTENFKLFPPHVFDRTETAGWKWDYILYVLQKMLFRCAVQKTMCLYKLAKMS